jgi:hypothetical protein
MSGAGWVQLDKKLGFNKFLASITSVELNMSPEIYKQAQADLQINDIVEITKEDNGKKISYPAKKGDIRCGYVNESHANKIEKFPVNMKVFEKINIMGLYKIKLDVITDI